MSRGDAVPSAADIEEQKMTWAGLGADTVRDNERRFCRIEN